jgi:hypothetical protein
MQAICSHASEPACRGNFRHGSYGDRLVPTPIHILQFVQSMIDAGVHH